MPVLTGKEAKERALKPREAAAKAPNPEESLPVNPELTSSVEKPEARTWVFQHPDHAPSNAMSAEITVQGVKVKMENSRVLVKSKDAAMELERRGFLLMNPFDVEEPKDAVADR